MAEQTLPVFILACVGCGKTVSGNETKCPRCGTSFDEMKFECPFCGETVTASQKKCDSCGTEFEIFAEDVVETSSVALDSEGTEPSSQPEQPGVGQAAYECPSCGKPVGETDTKCPSCGAMFH